MPSSYKPPPTTDTSSHHSSPNSGPQKPPFVQKPPARTVTGTIRKAEVPMHVTKHPNPAGRPRTPRT